MSTASRGRWWAAGALALALLAALTVRPIPRGRLLLHQRGELVSVVRLGPALSFRIPLGARHVLLDLGPVDVVVPAGDLQIRLRLRPDPAGDPQDLLAQAGGLERFVRQVLEPRVVVAGGEQAGQAGAIVERLRARSLLVDRQELERPAGATADLRADDTGLSVVLVGIDAADWDHIEPLLEQGRLPHLARLRAEGAWTELRTDNPPLSPLLWTTAVTGRPPDEHGIIDFVRVDPDTGLQSPISSDFRKVKALWNILTEVGMSVGVVAWWATWPAEPVEGVMVSDRVAFSLFDYQRGEETRGATYPPSYLDRVAALRVTPSEVGLRRLRELIQVDEVDLEASDALLARGGAAPYQDPVSSLRQVVASTLTYHRIARDLLDRGQPRLLAVYYQGLDEVLHRFAHLTPPPHPLASEEERRRYGGVVDAFYEMQDRLLGELLAAVGPETAILVVSDHGFARGVERPRDFLPYVEAGRPGRWHTEDGIWILHGPMVVPGRLDRRVRLASIAPTVLRLLGLPVAEDMHGDAVEEALAPAFRERHPVRRLASYETLQPAGPASRDPVGPVQPVDDEMMARLRSLGYLSPMAETAPGTGSVSANYHGNLGTIYLGRGDFERARQEYRAALELDPGHGGSRGGLIKMDILEGNLEAALEATLPLIRDGLSPRPLYYYLAAQMLVRTGRAEEGLDLFRALALERPDEPQILSGLGLLAGALGDEDGARRAFRKALDRKPDALFALQELYRLENAGGEVADLLQRCDAALEISARSVMPYNWKGLILRRMGREEEAEESFRGALERNPDSVHSLVNLSSLLVDTGRPGEAVPLLERILVSDRERWEARVNLVVALGRLQRLRDAQRVYGDADDTEPPPGGRTRLLNGMAYAYYLNGSPEEARPLLERSLALDPRQAEAQALLDRLGVSPG